MKSIGIRQPRTMPTCSNAVAIEISKKDWIHVTHGVQLTSQPPMSAGKPCGHSLFAQRHLVRQDGVCRQTEFSKTQANQALVCQTQVFEDAVSGRLS